MALSYKLVFTGRVLAGHSVDDVKSAIKKQFNLGDSKADAMFSGRKVVLKQDAELTAINGLLTLMTSLGAETAIEVHDVAESPNQSATESEAKQTSSSKVALPPLPAVPTNGWHVANTVASSEGMKRCIFCEEEILASAKKCKHCGSLLEGDISGPGISKPAADYGIFLLAIPVVAAMLIWFWVGNMNLFQMPGDSMALIMIATVVGTASVAAMEASKVGMTSNRQNGIYSPTEWFLIISLLWIIGYPAYMYKRRYFGLADHLAAGLCIAFTFAASWASMNSVIEDQKTELRGKFDNVQHQLESFSRKY